MQSQLVLSQRFTQLSRSMLHWGSARRASPCERQSAAKSLNSWQLHDGTGAAVMQSLHRCTPRFFHVLRTSHALRTSSTPLSGGGSFFVDEHAARRPQTTPRRATVPSPRRKKRCTSDNVPRRGLAFKLAH